MMNESDNIVVTETKNNVMNGKEFINYLKELIMNDAVGEYKFTVTEGEHHPALEVRIYTDEDDESLGSVGRYGISINTDQNYGLTSREIAIGMLGCWASNQVQDEPAIFGTACVQYYWMTHKEEFKKYNGDGDINTNIYDSLPTETKEDVKTAVEHIFECTYVEDAD